MSPGNKTYQIVMKKKVHAAIKYCAKCKGRTIGQFIQDMFEAQAGSLSHEIVATLKDEIERVEKTLNLE